MDTLESALQRNSDENLFLGEISKMFYLCPFLIKSKTLFYTFDKVHVCLSYFMYVFTLKP